RRHSLAGRAGPRRLRSEYAIPTACSRKRSTESRRRHSLPGARGFFRAEPRTRHMQVRERRILFRDCHRPEWPGDESLMGGDSWSVVELNSDYALLSTPCGRYAGSGGVAEQCRANQPEYDVAK